MNSLVKILSTLVSTYMQGHLLENKLCKGQHSLLRCGAGTDYPLHGDSQLINLYNFTEGLGANQT